MRTKSVVLISSSVALLTFAAVAQQPSKEASDVIANVLAGTMLPGQEVTAFEHSESWYPGVVVSRKGAAAKPIPAAPSRLKEVHFESDRKNFDLFDYITDNRVAGLLVLKDGRIAFEDYELGTSASTKWCSFSMAKSVSSTLVGAAIGQGLIAGIDSPITNYVPALKGGGYEGVSVRNLLQMASGVKWDETYTNPQSDVSKLGMKLLEKKPGTVVSYMSSLPKAGAPGSVWNYSTGETYLVGAVIEGATHKSLSAYLSETLWSKLGMEADATWWQESPGGLGLAGAGLGATLRDYGRFALFAQQDGVINGKRVVPEGWFRDAGSAHVIGGKSVDYGYLWWPVPAGDPVHKGAFQARGIYGQIIYVNPAHKVSIVVLSARSKPTGAAALNDQAFFAAVTKALEN